MIVTVPRSDAEGLVLVDVHAHLLPAGALAAARTGRPWHGLSFDSAESGDVIVRSKPEFRFRFNPRYWEPPAERGLRLDASGIWLQLVSVTGPLLGHGLDRTQAVLAAREVNNELADYAAADERFLGLAMLPLQDAGAAVAELERAKGLGFPGIVLPAQVNGENWDSARLFPVLQAAAKSGMFVLVHPDPWTGITDLGTFRLSDVMGQSGQLTVAAAALIFGGILDRLPELQVCMSQGGGFAPFVAGRFDQAFRLWRESQVVGGLPSTYLRRMYFDCLTFSAASLRCLIDAAGVGRIVAGTDAPSLQALADPASWLRGCGVEGADLHAILGGNLSSARWVRSAAVPVSRRPGLPHRSDDDRGRRNDA